MLAGCSPLLVFVWSKFPAVAAAPVELSPAMAEVLTLWEYSAKNRS